MQLQGGLLACGGMARQAETQGQNLNQLPAEVYGSSQRRKEWMKPGDTVRTIAHASNTGPMHLRFVESPTNVLREKQTNKQHPLREKLIISHRTRRISWCGHEVDLGKTAVRLWMKAGLDLGGVWMNMIRAHCLHVLQFSKTFIKALLKCFQTYKYPPLLLPPKEATK